jgi:hypothetical protein
MKKRKVLKIKQNEAKSSKFIVSLLKQDKKYYEKFLEIIGCKDYIEHNPNTIRTEKWLKDKNQTYGRADIWIGQKEGEKPLRRIIIENKLYAKDQNKQLTKYRKYLDKDREGLLYYLTLEGKPATSRSTNDKNVVLRQIDAKAGYKILSYHEHIIPWLEMIKGDLDVQNTPELKKIFNNKKIKLSRMVNENMRITEFKTKYKDKDLDKNVNEFRSLLELHFWNTLVEKIETEQNSVEIDNRRFYSMDKIRKHQEDKVKTAYGFIIGGYRVRTFGKKLKIGKGHFDAQNKWKFEKEKELNINLFFIENKFEAEKKSLCAFNNFIEFSKEF